MLLLASASRHSAPLPFLSAIESLPPLPFLFCPLLPTLTCAALLTWETSFAAPGIPFTSAWYPALPFGRVFIQ